MKPTPVSDIAKAMQGEWFGPADALSTGWALDSRTVQPGDLFLAVVGENVDGHTFVDSALTKGAVGAVVEKPVNGPHLLVKNLVAALAQMASGYRSQFRGPVIGITGSAGKTTTKELLAAALKPLGPILKTTGNQNTEFSVPLIWPDLTAETRAVVVEMAMRGFGQIEHLASFSRPNIGIVTNIGYSHAEMVGSREGIARAKGELLATLPKDGLAILWAEDEFLPTLRSASRAKVQTFGFSATADSRVTGYRPLGWEGCEVTGTLEGATWQINLPLIGRLNALNAAAALLAAVRAGCALNEAAQATEQAQLPPLRMEVRHWNGATILLDAYNASPPSMIASIDVLKEAPVTGRRIAVVGEMRELGPLEEEGHRAVGKALRVAGFDSVILYGPSTRFIVDELAPSQSHLVAESLADVQAGLEKLAPGDAALVKGSRALELEKAVP